LVGRQSSLFAFERVLETADGALHFAFDLLRSAIGLKLGVAGSLACGLFCAANGLLERALDAILVHLCFPGGELARPVRSVD
jgi:ABC-type nitrate/sulfonate/bicarbonate transport system permease component